MKIKDLELEDGILSKTNDSPYASLKDLWIGALIIKIAF